LAFLPQARFLSLVLILAAAACARESGREPPPAGGAAGSSTVLRTESERRGALIYRRENCARCHSLFDAPPDAGRYIPAQPPERGWGSRVGPDLGVEGHRHSDDWQYAHLFAPAQVVRHSPMTASAHLFSGGSRRPLRPTAEGRDLVDFLQALGRARRDVWADRRREEPEIPAPPRLDADLIDRGTTLYRRHCASCHGEAGDGQGEAAPLLDFPPRDFVSGRYRFRSTPSSEPPAGRDLYRTITLGTGLGAAMPSFEWLGERDRWALVARIREFSPGLRGTPLSSPVIRSSEDDGEGGEDRTAGPDRGARDRALARGRRLWDRLGCASCHGSTGSGLTREQAGAAWVDADGNAIPRSSDLTDACAMRSGASPGAVERAIFGDALAMPSYGEAVGAARDRTALRDYVLSLQDSAEGGPNRSRVR
jgi:mono/diheme cytochrome c family protein